MDNFEEWICNDDYLAEACFEQYGNCDGCPAYEECQKFKQEEENE